MRRWFFLSLFFLVSTQVVYADFQSLISQGDVLYDQYQDQKALKFYQQAEKINPEDPDLAYRLARSLANVGEELGTGTPEGQIYLRQAVPYAEVYYAKNPKNDDANVLMAMVKGYLVPIESDLDKPHIVRDLEFYATNAQKINPNNPEAYLMLAVLNRELSRVDGITRMVAGLLTGGLPDVSFDKALDYFKKADQIRPNHISTIYGTALTYLRMNLPWKAAPYLQRIEGLEITDHFDDNIKQLAQERLAQIQKDMESGRWGQSSLFRDGNGKSFLKRKNPADPNPLD